jgi:hypothetical protein
MTTIKSIKTKLDDIQSQLAHIDAGDAFLSFFEELDDAINRSRAEMAKLFVKYRHIADDIERPLSSEGDIDLLALALLLRDFDYDIDRPSMLASKL